MKIEELAFKDRKNLAQLNELDLLDIIEFLQNDRKQWIGIFTKTHNRSIEIRKENKYLKENWNKLKKDLELVVDYGLGDESSKWDKIYGEYAKSTLKFMQELEQGSDNDE